MPILLWRFLLMYPCARRVGSADPTNQSENRSDVRSLVSRRKRLLGYMVLQPVPTYQPGYPAAQPALTRRMVLPGVPDVRTHGSLWPAEKASIDAHVSHLSMFRERASTVYHNTE